MKWIEIIERFNDRDIDFVKDLFGDVESFIKIIMDKNLGHLIDPYADYSAEWQNDFLLYLYKNNTPRFREVMSKAFNDVVYQDGKFFFIDYEYLPYFFCAGRNTDYRWVAEKVLGEGGFDYFDYSSDDLYRDVIEDLNDKNIDLLCNAIVYELKEQNIPLETDLLEELSDENKNYLIIDSKNVHEVVQDKETMLFLLNNYLDGLNSNLNSIYSNAVNNAYEAELYSLVWDSLSEYFEGRGNWEVNPINNKNYDYRLEIKDFERLIIEYLEDTKGYGDRALLFNVSNFSEIIGELDCLDFRYPEYPDYNRVKESINELFTDYLY